MASDKNKATFEAIIQANKGIIYKVVNAYCHRPDDREDLAQEIMLQLWKSFGRYNDQYKVSTWMYRIALNVAISFYRKNLARQQVLVPISENTAHPANEEPQNHEQQLALLEQFISELKELDKALMLLYLEQKGQREIADILGISASNVSTKIARIKDNLKKKFLTYTPS
ncbi:sigma-70 family RNA polymerase sigma factor [Pontibacter sp. E15-1]|uniref:RNA polymerase sigma factor n=1 Tax=Pontibacter sp. E15-1 TaxID=2919918 RepID=UPI001F4FE47C|nr:sigma-70 family RNA polymerase sigma factor [Pontibacter sp. E15-1]MCJ8163908.1 sigma-70 family RNA polymerase sigma factor [Pontibacter sp. E15-1]